ncbi:MAG: hypothetical protein ACKO04_00270 [Actinomycetes bacterium]
MRTSSRRLRAGSVVLVSFVALVASACAGAPTGIPFNGGSFDVDVTIPSQTFSVTYGPCTTTVTTDPIPVSGATVTLPPLNIDLSQPTITVGGASVSIPEATLAAGTFSIGCFGTTFATLNAQLNLVGAAEIGTATIDTAARTVTLTDSTLTLDGSTISFNAGLGDIPLPPIDIPIPSFTISI